MAHVNLFDLLDESENELVNVVDSKAEESYLAEVKKRKEEEKKKQKVNRQAEPRGQEKKKQSQSYEQTKPIRAKRLVLPYSFRKSEIVLRKEKVVAANASAQSVPSNGAQDKGEVSANGSAQSGPTVNGSQSLNGGDSRPVSSTASTGSVGSGRYHQAPRRANGGQFYGRGDVGNNYSRRNYGEGSQGGEVVRANNGGQNYGKANGGNYYQGEERRINNGGQNYGRANGGGYNPRRNYRGANGGYQVKNQKQGGEEAKVDNGVVNEPDEEGWQTYHSRKRPDHHHNQPGYDQQPAEGDFVERRQGRRRWRRRGSEAENNQGDNNGEDKEKVEKEKEVQVVEEKQEQEGGVEEEGNKEQVESNGVDESSNKKKTDRKKTRNINGSQRKKLKKKMEAAAAHKSQGGEDNNAAAPDATSTAVSCVVVKEVTTLKEYEEKVVVPKKKGLEVVTKSSDSDFKRSTETLAKEFESMQVIGKKKWGDKEEEEEKISVSKPRDKSAEVHVKKDPAILSKIKTQKMSINEFHRQKKDDSTEGQQPSQNGNIEGQQYPQRDGKFGGHQRRSQRAGVKKPAPFKIEDAQFPPLGNS